MISVFQQNILSQPLMITPSVSYCSSPVVGRDSELEIGFNDNDRDNIEDVEKEKRNIEAVVENREELEDDSDYGGSGDHESQVFTFFLILIISSLSQIVFIPVFC